jgi:hypothetical protein
MKKYYFFLLLVLSAHISYAQWQHLGALDIAKVSMMAEDNDSLFAFTYAGIYMSLDDGLTWTYLSESFNNKAWKYVSVINFYAINDMLYVVVWDDTNNMVLFVSNDYGKKWENVARSQN